MLAAVAVSGIDDWGLRDFCCSAGAVFVVVADDYHIGIAADYADGIFYLLAFDFR